MPLLDKLALCLALPLLALAARPRNAILLSDVQSLTLRKDAKTAHRRVPPIPQLRCVSSRDVCRLYEMDVMRCVNQGSSYGGEDIEWSCTATLPEELKLGSTDVICEGYSSPDDPYVLKGSCGVEYRLVLTSKGEARYPHIGSSYGSFFGDGYGGTDRSAWLFTIVFVAVLAWILYSACFGNNQQRRPRAAGGGWRGGGGGGGGGGGWNPGWGPGDDPPPPYPGTKPHSSQHQRWTPGFWSGLAGGAAAGYMAGSRGSRDDGYQRGFASNWTGAGPSAPRPSPSPASSTSVSSARHESTGFGSTRRR